MTTRPEEPRPVSDTGHGRTSRPASLRAGETPRPRPARPGPKATRPVSDTGRGRNGQVRGVVVACGALALHVKQIAARRGWDLDVRPVPPELHNRPERIEAAVAAAAGDDDVVVAYAHCGAGLEGWTRLAGAHCYEVFGAAEHEPGTYFLTDFLVKSFDRVVWHGLGLDRHPELRDDYFRHYDRAVWLAQQPTPGLAAAARDAADRLGLPLEIRETGLGGLERQLEALLCS